MDLSLHYGMSLQHSFAMNRWQNYMLFVIIRFTSCHPIGKKISEVKAKFYHGFDGNIKNLFRRLVPD